MFYDHTAWQNIDEYKKFIFNSPAAQICGQLMRSTIVNFFFDSVFVRSTGTQFETPWHQDEPYWSVEGYDACTIWMPLAPVKKKVRFHLFQVHTFGKLFLNITILETSTL